jgi:hypothetical protein
VNIEKFQEGFCENGWTRWTSRHKPDEANDEIESILFVSKNCTPVDVECRTVKGKNRMQDINIYTYNNLNFITK